MYIYWIMFAQQFLLLVFWEMSYFVQYKNIEQMITQNVISNIFLKHIFLLKSEQYVFFLWRLWSICIKKKFRRYQSKLVITLLKFKNVRVLLKDSRSCIPLKKSSKIEHLPSRFVLFFQSMNLSYFIELRKIFLVYFLMCISVNICLFFQWYKLTWK